MGKPLSPEVTRREFGVIAAGAAGVLLTNSASAAEAGAKNGWIDAHVHVWTPDVESYPLSESFSVDDMRPKSFTPEELFVHANPSGVDRIVLIQMSYYRYDNRYMLDMIAKHPGVFSGVAIVDHHADDVEEKIENLASKGVRGLRIHPGQNEAKEWLGDEGMNRLWEAARASGVAVCPLINPADIVHVDALCEKYPRTRVVVDHFARIGVSGRIEAAQLRELCELARFPNTYVKTSAFYALGAKQEPYEDLLPMIRRVTEAFGAERLMWASDCPFQVQGDHSYEESIALIRDRADFLSDKEKDFLLRDTAAAVFFE